MSDSERWRYLEYATGRRSAREYVIKQIYVKHYRRKFTLGNFRASWIPNPEKLKQLYDSGNEKGPNDKCMLITINPDLTDFRTDKIVLVRFLIDVLAHVGAYKSFISEDAEFCLEHRGTDDEVRGVHMHIATRNTNAISKSDMIRRVVAAMRLVNRLYPQVLFTDQSVDVRFRPAKSAYGYIKKNRDYDLKWGLGFMGSFFQSIATLNTQIRAVWVDRARQVYADEIESGIARHKLYAEEVLESDSDDGQEEAIVECYPAPTQIA